METRDWGLGIGGDGAGASSSYQPQHTSTQLQRFLFQPNVGRLIFNCPSPAPRSERERERDSHSIYTTLFPQTLEDHSCLPKTRPH